MRLKHDKIGCIKIKRQVTKYQLVVRTFLHNLHGQFSGFHSFIFSLIPENCYFFNVVGTIFRSVGLKKVKVTSFAQRCQIISLKFCLFS